MSKIKSASVVVLLLLVGGTLVFSGCAWRTEFPEEMKQEKPKKAEKVVLEDYAPKADFQALEQRVADLEKRLAANEKLAAEAMSTADKALKCCRKEYVTVYAVDVFYGMNSFELSAEAKASIDKAADKLKADPDYIVEIAGHTDATGNRDYNVLLGQKRADAVRMYLIDRHHIDISRISIRSGGEDEPVNPNETNQGRSLNRRATVSVLGYTTE